MSDAVPLRAHIEIVGVGLLEAHPFRRFTLASADWPDGTHHAAMRSQAFRLITIEREPEPRGWCAVSVGGARLVELAPNVVTKVDDLKLELRPSRAPLAHVAMSVRGFDLIDTAWPLTMRAPQRLAAHDGRLVELVGTRSPDELPEGTFADFTLQRTVGTAIDDGAPIVGDSVTWCAIPARFGVPLRFVLEAGARPDGAPIRPSDVDRFEVLLDGTLREVVLGESEPLLVRPAMERGGRGLFPGVVEALFPERAREWRELEEQIAALPRSGA